VTDDRQQDVAFEPMRIGRRRRGPDPFLVGVAVVIGGLALAVIKPWEGPSSAMTGASPSPLAVASTAPGSTDAPPTPGLAPGTILFDDPLATVTVLDALGSHDEWGIQVVERAPDFRTGYRERWTAAPLLETGGRVVTMPAGEPVLAIGVTTPASETPLDVRVFRSDGNERWTWLDVHRVTTDRPAGSLLLRPPRVLGVDQAAWPGGTYRVEALNHGYIATIDVTLPYPTSIVPPPAVHLDRPAGTISAGFPIGMVRGPGPALMDGDLAMPIDAAVGSEALDPARAWLEARVSNEDEEPLVASVVEPFARVLAVMLPAGARGVDAAVSRVSPIGAFDPPEPIFMTAPDQDVLPFVAFLAPDGAAWKAGTYAIRVRWRDEHGRNDATWHVSLLPGEPDPEPAMLRAARAFEGFAGLDGIVVGPSFGRDVGPGGYVASYLAFERPADRGDALPIACGETFIGGKPEVVAVSHPIEVWTASVTMALLVPGGDTRPVPLRTAELRGLTLLEPARGASFAQGIYRIAIADEAGHVTAAMLCLGTSPFEG
jgi:hypothetical protein